MNNRVGLYDAVLIKENHIAAAGGVAAAVGARASARAGAPAARDRGAQTTPRSTQALAAGAPRLLLDNMSLEQLRAAVVQRCRPCHARGERRGRRWRPSGQSRTPA